MAAQGKEGAAMEVMRERGESNSAVSWPPNPALGKEVLSHHATEQCPQCHTMPSSPELMATEWRSA